jgi:hypothetical protein
MQDHRYSFVPGEELLSRSPPSAEVAPVVTTGRHAGGGREGPSADLGVRAGPRNLAMLAKAATGLSGCRAGDYGRNPASPTLRI